MAVFRLNDTFEIRAPKPADERGGFWDDSSDGWAWYESIQGLLDELLFRYVGQTIPLVIDGVQQEYWFVGGVLDVNFVPKSKQVETTIIDVVSGTSVYTLVWTQELKDKHGDLPVDPTVLVYAPSDPTGTWTLLRATIKYVMTGNVLGQMLITLSNLQAKIIIK